MRGFNDYHSEKELAKEKQELYAYEEKKHKTIEEETKDAGWDSLEGKPELVDEYVKFITRHSK